MPKIHVMRSKMIADVVVDPASHASLDHAASVLTSINAYVAGLNHATLKITDSRLARVDTPESAPQASEPEDPEPAADELGDMSENLRRVPKPAAAE